MLQYLKKTNIEYMETVRRAVTCTIYVHVKVYIADFGELYSYSLLNLSRRRVTLY
jgi:hypothetical protein